MRPAQNPPGWAEMQRALGRSKTNILMKPIAKFHRSALEPVSRAARLSALVSLRGQT
jgi:hypothetical protein